MNNAAVASITRRNSSGSRCRCQLNAPSASPVSAGTPTIMNALNVYRSIPATRWRIEPYSGTETRYPPPNMLEQAVLDPPSAQMSGPQSPATRPGSSFMIRFERHVYQAGSRVGALTEGSWRNVQPNATRKISVARRGTAGEARALGRPVSVFRTTCPGRSFVSANACGLPRPYEELPRTHGSAARIDDGRAAANTRSFSCSGSGTFWFLNVSAWVSSSSHCDTSASV